MSKIEENREKKKQAILAAAKSAFLSEGYASTSMDAIAAQAKLTKQTLYRYFPSKIELFQAILQQIGDSFTDRYSEHLAIESTRDALIAFATEFMRFHLSQEHIATLRLLITEASQEPEILKIFMSIGPDDTNSSLKVFFSERFNLQQPNTKIELWLGMLLASRSGALLGIPVLTDQQIEQHAIEATDLLLLGIQ
ncbi:TetR/AcrR family transcriptional regulator [Enterovibrio calviensis]|uniref:TetR/AcrR family transcriptional regulator n=1 Tax=Enterovibrio calviensis TaxID=91359 RepID=UPI000484050C|nr:TetR/AcrR family transcriptional regulator [Enterovibrio calviensis]